MKTLITFVILNFTTLVTANPSTISRGFANLIQSLNSDYTEDMDEILQSEETYLRGLAHGAEVYNSKVELLIGEEVELKDDPEEEEVAEEEDPDNTEDLPEELDLRDKGMMHAAIYQGNCGSCGWVSGTQTLEARIAIVSENYIPYSIQNFMNCAGKPCVGAQPYAVTTQAKKSNVIVPEKEVPYTKKQCVKEGEGKSACFAKCGKRNPSIFNNTLHDQFVIVAGTGKARTEAQLIKALQSGPVTTCFRTKSMEAGERCSNGCNHANSIIGYTKDKWILQESYGKHWGKNNDGSWQTTKGSICGNQIITKAHFPRIFYDYDRANAYYFPVEGGVWEEELEFVDKEKYGITQADEKNVGTAKNKCAYLGSVCKGVAALSSGSFGLVSDFGAGFSGDQTAFKKMQMVVYLRHDGSGKYIGIKEDDNELSLIAVNKDSAAPFFTSYSRFISFRYPRYHMVDNNLQLIIGGVRDIDETESWTLNNCNIYNDVSRKSFDLLPGEKGKTFLGENKYDPACTSQRFNIGLSGTWAIVSSELQLPLGEQLQFTASSSQKFRWNARQILNSRGHPFTPEIKLSIADFKFERKENVMRPRHCGISKLYPIGWDNHLAMKNNEVVMSSEMDSSWTFEYEDL